MQMELKGTLSSCQSVCAGKDPEHSVDNVGTVPAALTTFLACQRFQPDLIISVGTAGGFKAQGAAIGAVFVGTTTVNHDRRIPIPVMLHARICSSMICVCACRFVTFCDHLLSMMCNALDLFATICLHRILMTKVDVVALRITHA